MRILHVMKAMAAAMPTEQKRTDCVVCFMTESVYNEVLSDLDSAGLKYTTYEVPIAIGFTLDGCFNIAMHSIGSKYSTFAVVKKTALSTMCNIEPPPGNLLQAHNDILI